MPSRMLTLSIGVASMATLGVVAFAAANSVSNQPAPEIVIPASSHGLPGADDGPNHDAAEHQVGPDDPAGRDTSTTAGGTGRASTPATTAVRVSDDGPTHDVGDHSGGTTGATTVTTRVSDDGPNHDVGDDHGGGTNSGSGSSGSRSSGSGSSNSGSGSTSSGHGS